jgi:hypothetical protein
MTTNENERPEGLSGDTAEQGGFFLIFNIDPSWGVPCIVVVLIAERVREIPGQVL